VGIIDNAIRQVTANVKAAAANIEAGGDYGSALANAGDASPLTLGVGWSSALWDWCAPVPATQAPIIYPWAGDWLYVTRSSVGILNAALYNETADTGLQSLYAGRVIRTPFRSVAIFPPINGACSKANWSVDYLNSAGVLTQSGSPRLQVFYGRGECPFEESRAPYSDDAFIYTGPTSSLVAQSVSISDVFPAGSVLDVYLTANRLASAGTNVALQFNVTVYGNTTFANQNPDSAQQFQGASGTQAVAYATFRNVKVPKNGGKVVFTVSDWGTVPSLNLLNLNTPTVVCR
jgi:hypothetical protein